MGKPNPVTPAYSSCSYEGLTSHQRNSTFLLTLPRKGMNEKRRSRQRPLSRQRDLRDIFNDQRASSSRERDKFNNQRASSSRERDRFNNQRASSSREKDRFNDQRSSSSRERDRSYDQRASSSREKDRFNDQRSSSSRERGRSYDQRACSSREKDRFNDQRSSSSRERDRFNDQRASSSRERDRFNDQRASTSRERDRSNDQRSSSSRERGRSYDQRSSSSRERDRSYDQRSSSSRERGRSYDQRASSSRERDRSYDQRSSSSRERGRSNDQRSSSSRERDRSYDQRSSSSRERGRSYDQRASSSRKRDRIDDQRAITSRGRDRFNDQRATTSRERDRFNDQRASSSRERDRFNNQRASTSRERDRFNYQRASSSRERGRSYDQRASSSRERGRSNDQRSSSSRERGRSYDLRASTSRERDRFNDQRAISSRERDRSYDQRASSSRERCRSYDQRASSSRERSRSYDQRNSTSRGSTRGRFGTNGRRNESSTNRYHDRPILKYDDDIFTSVDKSDDADSSIIQASSSKAPLKTADVAELEPGTSGRNWKNLEMDKSKCTFTENNENHERNYNQNNNSSNLIPSTRSRKRLHSDGELTDDDETQNINQCRHKRYLMNCGRSVRKEFSKGSKKRGVVNIVVDVIDPTDGSDVERTDTMKESGHGKNDAPTLDDAGPNENKEHGAECRPASPFSMISSEDTSFFTPKNTAEDKRLDLFSFRNTPVASQKNFVANSMDVLVSMKASYESQDRFVVPTADFTLELQDIGIIFESEAAFIEIMKFLSDYFFLDEADMTIDPRTDVRICEAYTRDVNIKNCDCSSLHMCKFYLVGTCMAGNGCKFSHNEKDPHNQSVLLKHCLHKLSLKSLCKILNDVNNRNSTTSPTVCKFYNNEGNCRHNERCQHLHVCKHLVTGDCKYGLRCMRDHDFNSEHSKDILYKYGLDKYQYNHEALIPLLKMNMQNGVIKTNRIPPSMYCMPSVRTAIGKPENTKDKTTAATTTTTKEVAFIPLTETGRYFPMDRDKEAGKAVKQDRAIKEEQKGGQRSNDHLNAIIADVVEFGQAIRGSSSSAADRRFHAEAEEDRITSGQRSDDEIDRFIKKVTSEAKEKMSLRTLIVKREEEKWEECVQNSPEKYHENNTSLEKHITQNNLDLEPTSCDDKNYTDTDANEFGKENAHKDPTARNTEKCREEYSLLSTPMHTQKREKNIQEQNADDNSLLIDTKVLVCDEPACEMETELDNELNDSGINEVCEKKNETKKEQAPDITCDSPEEQHTNFAPTKDEEKKDTDLLTKLEVAQGDDDTVVLNLQDGGVHVKITGNSALDLENKIRVLASSLIKQADSMRSKTDANDINR